MNENDGSAGIEEGRRESRRTTIAMNTIAAILLPPLVTVPSEPQLRSPP